MSPFLLSITDFKIELAYTLLSQKNYFVAIHLQLFPASGIISTI